MTRRDAWWGGASLGAAASAFGLAADLGDKSGSWGWFALWLGLVVLTVVWLVEGWRTFLKAVEADARDDRSGSGAHGTWADLKARKGVE